MNSKTDSERLSVVETKVDRAASDIAEVKTNVTEGFAALNAKFDTLKDDMDKKYAAKWVQNAVMGVAALIVIAVISAWIALVIVPNVQKTQGIKEVSYAYESRRL